MDDALWRYIDASGEWWSRTYGIPRMTGRVFAWLTVCDPPEQTAAQLAEALDASKGSISGATATLVHARLVDRLHVRGERADRFRLRPEAWDDQIQDQNVYRARALVAQGLEALAGEPAARRARLEELDLFYEWWESQMAEMLERWRDYRRAKLGGGR